jgi:uncharacterized protein
MTLYMSAITLVIFIYHGIRYNLAVKRIQLKPALLFHGLFVVWTILFFTYPVTGFIEYWTQGSFSYSAYPKIIIYLFWYGAVFFGVIFSWLVSAELFSLIMKSAFRTGPAQRKVFISYFIIIITVVTAFYTGTKLIWHTYSIGEDVMTYELNSDTVVEFEPLTIVHISDLQADQYTGERKLMRYVDKVNSADPDIVIFAGDLITSGTDYIEIGASAMGQINSKYGVYAVIGDHDYWADQDRVTEALENRGITVLRDENIWIQHGESLIKLTGVTEIYSRKVDSDCLSDLLDEDMGEALKIVSSHQSTDRLLNQSKENGVHLLLAGHTHGGQIRIPVFFYPVTAVRSETRYVKGNWLLDGMLLNINSGLGFTLAPVRYNAPAEISVIRVH